MRTFFHFIHCTPGMHVLPHGTPRSLKTGFRIFLTASVGLWGLGATGTGLPWSPRLVPEVRDGAVTTALAAVICWASAIVIDRIDDKVITLACETAERRAQERRRHLQPVRTAPPR